MKTIAVLAGNLREFAMWAKEYESFVYGRDTFVADDTRYVYVTLPRHCYDFEFNDHITLGTFWERGDARQIYDSLRIR